MEKRPPITHEIKCSPPYFEEVWHGRKRFEARKDDRDYQTGDTVILREFVGVDYGTRTCVFSVGYVLRDYLGVRAGYCVFGLDGQAGESEPGSAPDLGAPTSSLTWRDVVEPMPDDGFVLVEYTETGDAVPDVWSARTYANALKYGGPPHLYEQAIAVRRWLPLGELTSLPLKGEG